MRTTVDLPPAVHRRAIEIAAASGRSLSATIADLTVRGLAQVETPVAVQTHPSTGLPLIRVGRAVTDDDVARLIDDD